MGLVESIKKAGKSLIATLVAIFLFIVGIAFFIAEMPLIGFIIILIALAIYGGANHYMKKT